MSMTDMTEGNISPESRIMLHKVKSSSSNNAPRRAPGEDEYTGEYELLFYLVFKNQVWNSESNQMEEGDERPTDEVGEVQGSKFKVQGEDTWYDLNGRRIHGKPTQKGIYINNGRKVVIK